MCWLRDVSCLYQSFNVRFNVLFPDHILRSSRSRSRPRAQCQRRGRWCRRRTPPPAHSCRRRARPRRSRTPPLPSWSRPTPPPARCDPHSILLSPAGWDIILCLRYASALHALSGLQTMEDCGVGSTHEILRCMSSNMWQPCVGPGGGRVPGGPAGGAAGAGALPVRAAHRGCHPPDCRRVPRGEGTGEGWQEHIGLASF